MYTAPATQKRTGSSACCTCLTKASRGHDGDYPRRSSFRKLCVLHLPHNSEPRPRPATQKRAAATAATRAAALSESSVYCACRATGSRGHCSDYPRRSSFRKLCVLRPSHKSEPRRRQEALRTASTTQKRGGHCGDYPRRSSFRKFCVYNILHLPRKSEPRPRRRLSAPQLLQYARVLRLPRNREPRPLRRLSTPQLLQEALCTAPATQQVAAATAATIRAAAPSGSSVYCACQATRL